MNPGRVALFVTSFIVWTVYFSVYGTVAAVLGVGVATASVILFGRIFERDDWILPAVAPRVNEVNDPSVEHRGGSRPDDGLIPIYLEIIRRLRTLLVFLPDSPGTL